MFEVWLPRQTVVFFAPICYFGVNHLMLVVLNAEMWRVRAE